MFCSCYLNMTLWVFHETGHEGTEVLSLFFTAYVLCKKNYSFSRVVFFQSEIANSFYSKMNDSSGVRTTWFWSGRYRFESQPLPTFFNLMITTENHDTAPFSLHGKFRYQNFPETSKISLGKFSVLWDKKKFRRKNVISQPLNLSSIKFFRY